MRALPESDVHVHYLESGTADAGEAVLQVLSPEEREKHNRFVFEKDRRIYGLAHALTRRMLAQYTDIAPDQLEFDTNAYGKPSLRAQGGAPVVGFNLSHTHGMVAVAVARESEIGLDVENTSRATGWRELTGKVFTPAEETGLWSLPTEEQGSRFFELWTLKEAYIKARGMGMSLPLEGFSMRLAERGRVGIEFGAAIKDDAAQWQFELFKIAAFRLAVAVRNRGGQRHTVRLFTGETGLTL